MEMVKDVKDGNVDIRFYKDRIVIEEYSQNILCKFCKIVIKKKLLMYYYCDPALLGDNGEGCVSVVVNISGFVNSIKADKKRQTEIEIFRSDDGKCAICFSHHRSGISIDRIVGTYELMTTGGGIVEDPYDEVYANLEPNCILDGAGLNDNLSSFKTNKQGHTLFSLKESGKITLSSSGSAHLVLAELMSNPNYPFIDTDTREENNYQISFAHQDILQLTKIAKLGPYNVIRVYMALDFPLLFQTRLLNYGTFSIWYTGKNFV
jgi:hypothetical protein